MPELDLVIRGGEVVNAGSRAVADVGIADGRVFALGGDLQAREEIDATGKLLLPGAIDAHVHLSGNWVDDYTSGSAAALAGGVTTVGSMTRIPSGETPLTALGREADTVLEQAIADVFLHPIIADVTPETLAEIPALLAGGCNTIKYFMSTPRFDPQALAFLEATRLAGESGLLTMIHCEDHAIIAEATARLTASGNTSLRYYPESRPVVSEVVATQRAVAIAETTGAPVYLVHLSSKRALEVCAEAQARGVPVYVEVRPLYLYFTRERFDEPEGPKYLGQPPLREQDDVDALWDGIRQGAVHTVCTDHAPWTLEQKLAADHNLTALRPGMENLQTLLPMLYSEGVRTGRISLDRLVEVLSTNTAKLFGLYPRKGTISVGADADIVVFDPEWSRVIDRSMVKSRAGHSVYEGWEVTGWPAITLRRGEVVVRDDDVVGTAGSGRLVHRGATQML
ncbi:MAG TPA: amidohydrolase family protein [Thermomicrobiaceae bacterium]|nr:amidohydrolase family protein [Thermomicrobiaceae bacterium]